MVNAAVKSSVSPRHRVVYRLRCSRFARLSSVRRSCCAVHSAAITAYAFQARGQLPLSVGAWAPPSTLTTFSVASASTIMHGNITF